MKKTAIPVLLILTSLLFFYQVFTKGLLPVPTDTLLGLYHPWRDMLSSSYPNGIPFKNALITDPIRQQIPWRKLVIDSYRSGLIPWWNPYVFSGTPLLANIQAGAFYPFNILFFLMPFIPAWSALIIVQPVLAAFFLYAFLRSKRIDPIVSAISGIAWGFSGFSVAWLTWGTIVQTAMWLPLLLLGIDRVKESPRPFRWALLLAFAAISALFAGHIQIALYVFLLAGMYAVQRFTPWTLAAGTVAFLVTSLQWSPLLQFLGRSGRVADASVYLREGWFLPWQNLVQFIAPDFFGNPATLNYTGIWNYGEFIGYIGILPLLFALWAVVARRDRFTRFFAMSAAVVFLFLLPTPIAWLPYIMRVPFLSSLQPTRLMVLVDFCLVVLAGLGLDHFVRNRPQRIWIIVGLLAAVAAGLWLYPDSVARHNLILPSLLMAGSALLILVYRTRWKALWLLMVFAFVAFDVFRFGWKFTPFTPAAYFFPVTKSISFLQNQKKPFRVVSLDNRAVPPNVLAYYGLETPEGYDPVYWFRYGEFIAALNRKEPNINPPFGFNRIITLSTIDSPLFPLLNVKYIVSLAPLNRADTELMYREGLSHVYWYKKAMPRFWAVESVRYAKSAQEVMNGLYAKDFNPRMAAITEEQADVPAVPLEQNERVTALSDYKADFYFTRKRFVVIANTFDPGWKAYVDGTQVNIYLTDYLFQGIIVPAGGHSLEMRYNY